jgi:hypothetical protein
MEHQKHDKARAGFFASLQSSIEAVGREKAKATG